MRTRDLFFALSIGLAIALFSQCTDSEPTATQQGGQFDCSGNAICQKTCSTKYCDFSCRADANCIFICPNGDCKAATLNAQATQVNCTGDSGCNLTCTNTKVCAIQNCTGNCELSCNGAETCFNDCSGDGCKTTP